MWTPPQSYVSTVPTPDWWLRATYPSFPGKACPARDAKRPVAEGASGARYKGKGLARRQALERCLLLQALQQCRP